VSVRRPSHSCRPVICALSSELSRPSFNLPEMCSCSPLVLLGGLPRSTSSRDNRRFTLASSGSLVVSDQKGCIKEEGIGYFWTSAKWGVRQ
jgi:hypothetical protein